MAKRAKKDDGRADKDKIDSIVGRAIYLHRNAAGITITELSRISNVSKSMVSRIENGNVSPSLSTLESLSKALDIPLISLFNATAETVDITHIKNGRGLIATRMTNSHDHQFHLLGYHKRPDFRFEPLIINLVYKEDQELPKYHNDGCTFIYILEGEAIYTYGEKEFHLKKGDSLSFDALARHGFERLLTNSVVVLSIEVQKIT